MYTCTLAHIPLTQGTHLIAGEDDDDTDPDHSDAGDEKDDHDDGQVHQVPQLAHLPVHGVHPHPTILSLLLVLLRLHIGSLDLGKRVVNLKKYFFYVGKKKIKNAVMLAKCGH